MSGADTLGLIGRRTNSIAFFLIHTRFPSVESPEPLLSTSQSGQPLRLLLSSIVNSETIDLIHRSNTDANGEDAR